MKKIKEESVGGDREVEGRVKGNKDMFDAISPFDFRYYGRDEKAKRELGPYLSERAFIVYQLRVECALVKVLADRGICNQSVYREVKHAAGEITPEEVYAEEDKIHHNIRALVNCIQKRVSYAAKPFVHLTATSYDIIENANAARYRDAACAAVIPELCKLMDALIALALREKNTLQAGRTHGQHAEPITFGFTVSGYVARLGDRIEALQRAASSLRGKFSGAVGAYNASALFFSDPEGFEKDVLKELGLEPCMQSSQVAQAEYLTDFVHAVVSCFSVLANIADDMRHLQRSEINEIAEVFGERQVGSSTMPHKRNPINFENVKSLYKECMPRMVTRYLDQISEHQRDLTNSASSRFVPEIIAALYLSAQRLTKVMSRLVVDKEALSKNFLLTGDMVAAEPMYILLAFYGHPDAHEYVRKKTLESQKTGRPLHELVLGDRKVQPYCAKLTPVQKAILKDPGKYRGIAAQKAERVCTFWKKRLVEFSEPCAKGPEKS